MFTLKGNKLLHDNNKPFLNKNYVDVEGQVFCIESKILIGSSDIFGKKGNLIIEEEPNVKVQYLFSCNRGIVAFKIDKELPIIKHYKDNFLSLKNGSKVQIHRKDIIIDSIYYNNKILNSELGDIIFFESKFIAFVTHKLLYIPSIINVIKYIKEDYLFLDEEIKYYKVQNDLLPKDIESCTLLSGISFLSTNFLDIQIGDIFGGCDFVLNDVTYVVRINDKGLISLNNEKNINLTLNVDDFFMMLNVGIDLSVYFINKKPNITSNIGYEWYQFVIESLKINKNCYTVSGYEIFCGMCFVEVTNENKKYWNSDIGKMVISYIFPKTLAYKERTLDIGYVLEDINGVIITDCSNFRQAVKNISSEDIIISACEHRFIINVKNAIEDDMEIFTDYTLEGQPLLTKFDIKIKNPPKIEKKDIQKVRRSDKIND